MPISVIRWALESKHLPILSLSSKHGITKFMLELIHWFDVDILECGMKTLFAFSFLFRWLTTRGNENEYDDLHLLFYLLIVFHQLFSLYVMYIKWSINIFFYRQQSLHIFILITINEVKLRLVYSQWMKPFPTTIINWINIRTCIRIITSILNWTIINITIFTLKKCNSKSTNTITWFLHGLSYVDRINWYIHYSLHIFISNVQVHKFFQIFVITFRNSGKEYIILEEVFNW